MFLLVLATSEIIQSFRKAFFFLSGCLRTIFQCLVESVQFEYIALESLFVQTYNDMIYYSGTEFSVKKFGCVAVT